MPPLGEAGPKNLVEVFLQQASRLGSRQALSFKNKASAQYESLSWSDWKDKVLSTAQALAAQGIGRNDKVAIMAENRPEWTFVDLGALSLGAVIVPIYPTLALPDVVHILRHSESKMLFISSPEISERISGLKAAECPQLESHILFGQTDFFKPGSARLDPEGTAYLRQVASVQPDDVATIIYTSGTTGPQKGVMLTHRNFMENARMAQAYIHLGEKDVALSFLPLSHVFERLAGYYFMIAAGATIAYAESMNTVPQDIRLVRPTVAAAVPRFYEKVYTRIMEQVRAKSPRAQKIFHWALATGRRYQNAKKEGPVSIGLRFLYLLASLAALRKIKQAMGGRIRYFISGGAPLSRHLAEFFYAAGILILEGYGLTETSPVIAVNSEDDFLFGTVGKPLPGIEVRIAADGEIMTRSACVMKGYYRDPEATARVMQDSWFATGDIGQLNDRGFLIITDRKKDLIVTSGGKNIAPQNLEGLLMEDPLIQQAVVIGDKRNYLIALIVPRKDEVLKRAAKAGLATQAWHELVQSPAVRAWITAVVEEKMQNKAHYEQIKYFALLDQELSLESGELTPTLKVKRRVVMEKYAPVIEAVYREGDRLRMAQTAQERRPSS